MWVVRVGGDDGELRPWHFIHEGGRGRWETPTMAPRLNVSVNEYNKSVSVTVNESNGNPKLSKLTFLHYLRSVCRKSGNCGPLGDSSQSIPGFFERQAPLRSCSLAQSQPLASLGIQSRAGLYLFVADVNAQSHPGHPTRGCIPKLARGWDKCRARGPHFL